MRIALLTLVLFLEQHSRAQHYSPHTNQQALFASFDDLSIIRADTNCHLRKVDDVRVDSIIHRCWFTDHEKGMIKNSFAVSFQGKLYIQDQAIRQLLPATFHPRARQGSNCFYPAIQHGHFYYCEILSEEKDPDLTIAMGVMGGAVGAAFGNTLTPPDHSKSFIILDQRRKTIYGIDSWKDMHSFLEKYDPTYSFSILNEKPSGEDVHKILVHLEKD